MENEDVLRGYIPIANYIQSLNCGNSEVVIHNLAKPESSVFYVVGNVTNRALGAPLTQYAIDILKQKLYEKNDFISGYMGQTNDGKVIMRSSTMFIRNGSAEPIGLLCVNIDVTPLVQSCKGLEAFVGFPLRDETRETIHPSPETMVEDIVRQVEQSHERTRERFGKQQKLDAIIKMGESGLLRMKGAVHLAAQSIGVSEKTVYRYMSEIGAGKDSR